MDYNPINFDNILGTAGFSDAMLQNHFALYRGYVTNVNKIAELSQKIEIGSIEGAELRRRFGWEYNGMVLHELYFGNLSKNSQPIPEGSKLTDKITERFGSLSVWEKDFRAAGAMRGIGWVILYYDKKGGRLFNVWVNEHDVGHLSGCVPLLVMDVFEHAYMLDYGLKKADYIEAFFKAIDWKAVEGRFA